MFNDFYRNFLSQPNIMTHHNITKLFKTQKKNKSHPIHLFTCHYNWNEGRETIIPLYSLHGQENFSKIDLFIQGKLLLIPSSTTRNRTKENILLQKNMKKFKKHKFHRRFHYFAIPIQFYWPEISVFPFLFIFSPDHKKKVILLFSSKLNVPLFYYNE